MSDPIDAIELMMAKRKLSRRDLLPVFGTTARASEVMNRKRPLTLRMIRALNVHFRMSAKTLIEEYEICGYRSTREQEGE